MRLVINTTELEVEAYRAIKEACAVHSEQPIKQLLEINAIVEHFENLISEVVAYGKKCD